MRDQELFKQLHNLSKMKPDTAWKDSQRSIMLSQVNAGNDAEMEETKGSSLFLDLFKLPVSYVQSFSQPVLATFLVAFLFLTGGFVGLRVSQETKPGDSLYLAKIVGEKTQLALAFTDKKKAQLGLGFAVRRVEEIKQVMNEETGTEAKDDKVERLVADFKKEISAAKLRIERISKANSENDLAEDTDMDDVIDNVAIVDDGMAEVDEGHIFSAGFNKADDGLQVFESEDIDNVSAVSLDAIETNENIGLDLTATEKNDEASTTEEELTIEMASPESILQQVSDLLQEEAYGDILDILDNAGLAVDQSYDMGEVRGVEESGEDVEVGTSTEE